MNIGFRLFLLILLSNSITQAVMPDSASVKDNAAFIDNNFGISNVILSQTIAKDIQGVYTSTLFYDSSNSEYDTSFVMNVSDTYIETKNLITNITKTEKTAFFARGTHTVSGADMFITYSENDVFLILTKATGNYTRYGEYSLLILYLDRNGPASMNFILRKVKS